MLMSLFTIFTEAETKLRPLAEAELEKWASVFTVPDRQEKIESSNPYLQKVSITNVLLKSLKSDS